MNFVRDDGGRAAAGFAQARAGDCVARAVAIASGRPYREVYDRLAAGNAGQRVTAAQLRSAKGKRNASRKSADFGIYTRRKWFRDYMAELGFTWTPTMRLGQGCTVHLHDGELPPGRLVVSVSKHMTAVIDGNIHDTHDPRRAAHCTERYREPMPAGYWTHDGVLMHHVARRCVYGFWTFERK